MKNTSLIIFTFCIALQSFGQHNIIPEPVNYTPTEDRFLLKNSLQLRTRPGNSKEVSQMMSNFSEYIYSLGYSTPPKNKLKESQLMVDVNSTYKFPNEGYNLVVSTDTIFIKAKSTAGLHNALQTVKQLLPANKENGIDYTIPGCVINDYPRFAWRGLMLDVSRHFFTVEEVKAYIDQMSEYKFNVFHWHLTDDNGWRIEIKSLPKLTEVGAWRVERHGSYGDQRTAPKAGEKTPYGGFYTQEQIKEVVAYAAARNITVVPEIDIPGHSMAVLAGYPELSTLKEQKMVCPGHKFAVWPGDGTFKMLEENTLDPSNEKVYEFVDKVFGEIATLFPSEYIHMGGDECYKGYWEESTEVQAFMKKKNIKDAHELQSYFVGRVQKIINSHGKKMIGWDEIIEGGLKEGAAVMSWQGMKGGIHAAKKGHKVVMSPTTYAYLDYQQGDLAVENSIYANLTLEKSYLFEPVPEGVDSNLILGGQANVWTEAIPTLDFAYYMTYPRAFSIAETVWSPKNKKDWNNFMSKTEAHFDRFDAKGKNICKAVYEPTVKVFKKDGKIYCELTNSVANTEIYYSVNNTYPVNFDTKYTTAFEIPKGKLKLRTQTFRGKESLGRELIINRKDLVKRAK